MWPFKKSGETVDLTYLAKRGIIKNPPVEQPYKDLSQNDLNPIPMPVPQQASQPEEPSGTADIGFLGSMSSSSSGGSDSLQDIQSKLDILSRRVNSIMDRLDLVERKVDRNDRQGV